MNQACTQGRRWVLASKADTLDAVVPEHALELVELADGYGASRVCPSIAGPGRITIGIAQGQRADPSCGLREESAVPLDRQVLDRPPDHDSAPPFFSSSRSAIRAISRRRLTGSTRTS